MFSVFDIGKIMIDFFMDKIIKTFSNIDIFYICLIIFLLNQNIPFTYV